MTGESSAGAGGRIMEQQTGPRLALLWGDGQAQYHSADRDKTLRKSWTYISMLCLPKKVLYGNISVMMDYTSQDVGVTQGKLNLLSGKSARFSIVKYF